MDKKKLLECISFFDKLNITEEDVTSDIEKLNGQKVVIAKYLYQGKTYTTKKLYYRDISNLNNIKNKQALLQYFGAPVFWLDIENHGWPQESGESDLDKLVINDMADINDLEFNSFLKRLANNQQSGYIQRITADGRSGQYYHNLENNNHWHDLVLLIKAVIDSGGKEVDKRYFSRLVFKWDGNKNTIRERSTFTNKAYWCNRGLVERLYENIKSIQHEMMDMEIINLLKYKKQIVLQGPPGTGKTFTAKDIAEQMIFGEVSRDKKVQNDKLEKTEQFQLIQFHPSYSYEDFVRGIVAESNGNSIEYKTTNKILGQFADDAYQNFVNFQKKPEVLSIENWINQSFSKIIELLQSELAEKERYNLTQKVFIYQIEEECFRYKGDDWTTTGRINFSDIKKLIFRNLNIKDSEYQILETDSKHAWYRQSYYKPIIKYFFEKSGEYLSVKEPEPEKLKDYILLIDEINRANLPSVLGELIYALEYRGESVESMYDVEGDRKIIIPPNLYIIGTMNTADRSVGHIDYAIRRRFAFVDIPPSPGVIEKVIVDTDLKEKSKKLYAEVSTLFNEKKDEANNTPVFLAADFKTHEVQLGHSYFLAETEEQLKLKLEYEIKPILYEYVKDGILTDGAREIIKNLHI